MADDQSTHTTTDQSVVTTEEPKNAGHSTESGTSRSSDLAEESAMQHLDVSNLNLNRLLCCAAAIVRQCKGSN